MWTNNLALACLVVLAVAVPAQRALAMEVVHFSGAVLPPGAFKLRQAKEQGIELQPKRGVPIWAHLARPEGDGPFPALVLLHGCAGLFPSDARWAERLSDLGYVTLMVDSLRPRSLFNICRDPLGIASPEVRALDANGALGYLQGLPFVDPARVAVVGWSHGGTSALEAVDTSGMTAQLAQRFAAAIAFYPYCVERAEYDVPILVLAGEADDWTPLDRCRQLKVRSGADMELVGYSRAFHGFDVPELGLGRSVEGQYGKTYRLQYDKEAHEDAAARIEAFLARHLRQR